MNELAINIEGIGKKYRLGAETSGSLRDTIKGIFNSNQQNSGEFWALKDIDLQIKSGEAVGIIGRNGAGKSTLLKIISRITEPTSGRIELTGRVSSLLEVGTGFHPELTGRENVYLNGTILGMSRKEVKSKFEDIVRFSGVEKFIDTPVKHYSSGMKVRLAFSVAAHLEPEILLIDEVLAVGDAEFQRKCLGKMEESTTGGRTVLFVSHNLGAVNSFCSRTLYLENGMVKFFGETNEAIDQYLHSDSVGKELSEVIDRSGDGRITFEKLEFVGEDMRPKSSLFSGMELGFKLYYNAHDDCNKVVVRLQVVSAEGQILFTCNNFHSGEEFNVQKGRGYFMCQVPDLPLNKGEYFVNIQCTSERVVTDELMHVQAFHIEPGNFFPSGRLPSVRQGVLIKHNWSVSV